MVGHIAKISLLLVSLCSLQTFVSAQDRIYGGTPISIKRVPCFISIRCFKEHVCGGALISKYHVLSSGIVRTMKISEMRAVGGISSINERGVISLVDKLIMPYDVNVDLVVLKLVSPMYGANIGIIGRSYAPQALGNYVHTYGFGQRKSGGPYSYGLETASMTLISRKVCNKLLKGTRITLTDTSRCMDSPTKSTCYGDEGGPVITQDYKLYGIASYVPGCGRGYPSVFTGVWLNNEFIDHALKF